MRLRSFVTWCWLGLAALGISAPGDMRFDGVMNISNLTITNLLAGVTPKKAAFFPGGGSPTPSTPNVSSAVYYSEALLTTNEEISFYRKSNGALLFNTSISAFFGATAVGDVQNQATCAFDRVGKRWIIAAVDTNTNSQSSAALLAISDDSTLGGNWYKVRLPLNLFLISGPYYLGQPSIGICNEGLALSLVSFDFDDNLPVAASILGFNKASAYLGGANNTSQYNVVNPVRLSLTNDPSASFIWGAYASATAQNQITWVQMGNFGTSISYQTFPVTISQSWTDPSTNAACSNGGLKTTGDWVTSAANFQDKRVAVSHVVEVAGRKAIEILSFTYNSGTPIERQINRITGAAGVDLYMPAIAFNQRGDLGVTYNRSSATTAPVFVGEVRAYETVSAQMMPATVLAPSSGTAYGSNDWSQFSSLSVDPADSLSFWGGGAVFNAAGGWISRLERAAPTYPTIVSFSLAPSGVVTGNNATGTVQISTPAPSQGFSMELADDSAALSTPDRVTIPAGQTTGTFLVSALPSSVPITRHVILKLGNLKLTRNLNILLPDITSVVSNQAFVTGGQAASFTINANGTVGNSFVCAVASSGPELIPPSTVTFSYGQSTRTFTANTLAVAVNVSRYVSVTRNGRTRTATVLIKK
ncbi:MAG: hypothetical protein ABL949_03155 [Fimbriimonadaceae bacterium]